MNKPKEHQLHITCSTWCIQTMIVIRAFRETEHERAGHVGRLGHLSITKQGLHVSAAEAIRAGTVQGRK
jgi:hypothetical protein